MLRALHIFLVGVIIDFFLFPVEFTALPDINTKVMLAGLGIGLLAYEVIRTRKHNLPTDIIYATFFAIFYSIVNLIAVELNETYDYSYANYVSSFLIWMFSAFSIVWITRTAHKKISLRLFTSYFTVICVFQCVIALVIDKYEEVDRTIDEHQGKD